MADENIRAAIDNWAPRLIAQGVDYNDLTVSGTLFLAVLLILPSVSRLALR